jgi:ubiquinone/menaquinone biosynthesis C-methylase UbiE
VKYWVGSGDTNERVGPMTQLSLEQAKKRVQDFWEAAPCGERLLPADEAATAYRAQAARRYELEPYIPQFAGFEAGRGKKVLEIGVGLGADHARWAEAGAELTGIDLTEAAIEHTRSRLELFGLRSRLELGDAEHLPFRDGSFDIVYAWGVLHHSPDTQRAYDEVLRVLKPGGVAKLMVYHTWSLVGYMLWLRYALGRGRPWLSLRTVYDRYLESPGTKAFTRAETRRMLERFSSIEMRVELSHGDLLSVESGSRHQGTLLSFARRIWPRRFIRMALRGHGLFLLISARK